MRSSNTQNSSKPESNQFNGLNLTQKIVLLRSHLAAQPNNAPHTKELFKLLVLRGYLASKDQYYTEAYQDLNEAVNLSYPKGDEDFHSHAYAYYLLVLLLQGRNDTDQINFLSRAIDSLQNIKKPSNGCWLLYYQSYAKLSEAYYRTNELENALAAHHKATQYMPHCSFQPPLEKSSEKIRLDNLYKKINDLKILNLYGTNGLDQWMQSLLHAIAVVYNVESMTRIPIPRELTVRILAVHYSPDREAMIPTIIDFCKMLLQPEVKALLSLKSEAWNTWLENQENILGLEALIYSYENEFNHTTSTGKTLRMILKSNILVRLIDIFNPLAIKPSYIPVVGPINNYSTSSSPMPERVSDSDSIAELESITSTQHSYRLGSFGS